MKKENGIVVYINNTCNSIAIFSTEERDDDCLYFTHWFYEPDFWRLYLLSWAAEGEIKDFIDSASAYLSEAEIDEIKVVDGDRESAEQKIKAFCSNWDKWDGSCNEPDEGGIKNFDQFWEMDDFSCWDCIYSDRR